MATTLHIRALAHGGAGVGTPEGGGPTWFVPAVLPGETVTAEVEHEAKRHIKGRLLEVVEPSPHRVDPPCPLAATCGGCAWQHIDPAAQPDLKRDIVADQLRAVVPRDRVRLRFGADAPSVGYRHRARLHYDRRVASGPGGFTLGFHAARSRDVVDVPSCPVLVPALDRGFARLQLVADVLPEQGEVVGLTDGTSVVLGLPGVRPEQAEALRPLLGPPVIGVDIRGGRQRAALGTVTLDVAAQAGLPPLRIGPFAFAQPQAAGNRALVQHVAAAARADGSRVLELFAGAGNFTRALARHASRVWASDTDREAVECLQNLARAHHLPINAKRQSATSLLPKLAASDTRYDLVVVDPPKAGLGKEAAAALGRVAAQRIVYVSCDPATLARDLTAIGDRFDIVDVSVFDLVPMTPQVEVVATLVARGRP